MECLRFFRRLARRIFEEEIEDKSYHAVLADFVVRQRSIDNSRVDKIVAGRLCERREHRR